MYYGKVDQLTSFYKEHETLGPKLLERLPGNIKKNRNYSFMMKDNVLVYCLDHLKKLKKLPQL